MASGFYNQKLFNNNNILCEQFSEKKYVKFPDTQKSLRPRVKGTD